MFAKNEINTSRQPEIDLTRVICLIGMVFIHVYEYGLVDVSKNIPATPNSFLDIAGGASGATCLW